MSTEIIKVTLQLSSNKSGEEVATVFTTYKNISGHEYQGFNVYDDWNEGFDAANEMVDKNNGDFVSRIDDFNINDFREGCYNMESSYFKAN